MRLADRWGRPLQDVMNMTTVEFNMWVTYFRITKNGTQKD